MEGKKGNSSNRSIRQNDWTLVSKTRQEILSKKKMRPPAAKHTTSEFNLQYVDFELIDAIRRIKISLANPFLRAKY